MNKNRHRIVFNAARGQRMAVSETASTFGRSSSPPMSVLALAAVLLFTPAHAQVVADPSAPGNQRPTILQTANGLPQVNIQTPSAAGVSRNTYRQFDIDARGAILNNSRTGASTQLAGQVTANPWLATGEARVILNEVNSNNPSYLKGPVEVAGQRAEVVIANPSGIRVNGGTFLNASGVTLSTGTPVMNSGNLESFRVGGGTVVVEGLGLDTRTADYTTIMARAMEVNAGLWAKHLTVVTGANDVKALATGAAAQATPIAGTGPAPSFMLDVAAIGGMYAGHIFLVGTEAGLGVNNRGTLAAQEGKWVLQADGWLANTGKVQAKGDLSIQTSGAISNTGANAVISSQGQATLTSGSTVTNTDAATMVATDALSIHASGALDNTDGHIASQSHLTLSAGESVNNQGAGTIFGERVAIATTTLNNRSTAVGGPTPVIAANQQLDIGVQTLNNEDGALLYSGGALAVGGGLDASQAATGPAQTVNNLSANMEAMGELRIAAQTLTNERRNVQVNEVQIANETATLNMPSWWVNGKNWGPLESTSNHSSNLYYVLDPANILSDTRLVTPDGNVIHRIEVALDPKDSVFLAARGSYAGAYGARDRVTVGAGTTVLYALLRQDGVSNPDQVAGAPEAFAADFAGVGEWQRDNLSYSNAYGRCTTQCTVLKVQTGYTDPQSTILRGTQRNLSETHAGLEVSRTAHHTEGEDRLNPDAGALAAIRSGGGMQLNIGTALTNRYADIQAGTTLDVQAAGATVSNTGKTLKRTQRFQNTSQTAGGDSFDWTASDVSEVIGQLGGALSGTQQLNITAANLFNIDQARSTGLTSALGALPSVASAPLTLPRSAMLHLASPSTGYLVESDPRFTNYASWLGSDYMLAAIAHNPATTLKRLGDGFYEQRLIREQVAQLTGRRFLQGYANDEAQFRALMDSGVTYAQQWHLVPGIGLTAEQMTRLTTDLVWLVEREVVLPDGTQAKALVPQLYVRQLREGDFQASGALLAGNSVNLQIQEDLINAGGRIEGDGVVAEAGRDLSNVGGLMQARSELLAKAGRDVTISSCIQPKRSGSKTTPSATHNSAVSAWKRQSSSWLNRRTGRCSSVWKASGMQRPAPFCRTQKACCPPKATAARATCSSPRPSKRLRCRCTSAACRRWRTSTSTTV